MNRENKLKICCLHYDYQLEKSISKWEYMIQGNNQMIKHSYV